MTVCATAQEAPAQSGHSVTNNPYVLAVCMADKRTQQTVLSHDDHSLARRDYQICFFFLFSVHNDRFKGKPWSFREKGDELDGWLTVQYIQLGSHCCCSVEPSNMDQEDNLDDLIS